MKKALKTSIFTILFCAIMTSVYAVEYGSKAAKTLIKHGIKEFKSGNVKATLNDFSRALLIDPENITIQDHILHLAAYKGFNGKDKVNIVQLEDLIYNLRELRKISNYFYHKNSGLAKILVDNGYKTEVLNEKVLKIQKDLGSIIDRSDKSFKEFYSQNQSPLENVLHVLNEQREELAQHIQVMQGQYEQLKYIHKEYCKYQPKPPQITQSPIQLAQNYYSQNFYNSKSPNNHKGYFPVNSDNTLNLPNASSSIDNIEALRKELAILNNQLNALQSNLDEKENQITVLTNQVVDFSNKLNDQETRLANSKTIDSTSSNSNELDSRLKLSQQIIKEKDSQIKQLDSKLRVTQITLKNQETLDYLVARKEQELNELKSFLRTYAERLSKANSLLDEKTKDARGLSQDLNELRYKYAKSQDLILKKEKQIDELKQDLQEVRSKIRRSKQNNDEYKFNKLRKSLNEYRSGFKATHKDVDLS